MIHKGYAINLLGELELPGSYDAWIEAVAHDQFKDIGIEEFVSNG